MSDEIESLCFVFAVCVIILAVVIMLFVCWLKESLVSKAAG